MPKKDREDPEHWIKRKLDESVEEDEITAGQNNVIPIRMTNQLAEILKSIKQFINNYSGG